MKIVCISGKAQNGKDTTANFLSEALTAKGYRVLIAHFGDLVKYVCKTFFGWDGKKDEKGRTLLQYVGTDKIRAVSPDYWANFIVSILDIFRDESIVLCQYIGKTAGITCCCPTAVFPTSTKSLRRSGLMLFC